MDTSHKNNEKIFEKVYEDHADALFRFVISRVSDKEQAVDIVEDTFVRFWQTLQKEEVGQVRALLYRISRNLVIDWYKKKKSIPASTFGGDASDTGKAPFYMDMFQGNITGVNIAQEARLVIEKIAALEPIYREAVYLRYVEEMTPTEIAGILGETPNAISVRINRGVKLLQEMLHIEK